ncbi:MAG: complex I NDUFA9 subunit family protein [Robiginitomaculum sp.]
MEKGLVTVFGANGFLGHQVVRKLAQDGWRIRAAVRRPHVAQELRVMGSVGQIQIVQANLRFPDSIAAALNGVDAVVNLAGIFYQQGAQKFDAVHNEGAASIADAAKHLGIANFVHISFLSPGNKSKYALSKARGEKAVKTALPSADILRPTLFFGEGDRFFSQLARLARLSWVMPLIGRGKTRLQPVYVGDVASAIAKILNTGTHGNVYELAGSEVYTLKQLLQFTMQTIDRRRFLMPVFWPMAKIMGFFGEIMSVFSLRLFKPMITRDQVDLLKTDIVLSDKNLGVLSDKNLGVLSDKYLGFDDLGIMSKTLESIMPDALEPYKKYGQFHDQIVS